MLKRIIVLSLALCLLALPAAAANLPGAFSISPMLGRHTFEGNLSLDSSTFWGVGVGYNLTENWGLEGVYTHTDTDAEDASTTDTKVETYRLDVLYHFMPDQKLVPYVAAGLGAIYSSPAVGADRDHLLFNYGVGIKYYILDDLIALRADVRHLVDFPEPDNSLQYSAGLTFQLGKSSPPPVPVAMEQPKDSDGDGVFDDADQCPETPAGAIIDTKGCPLDSDGDGVFDYMDQCPGTPTGTAVDSKGCPLDSDGDGVFDDSDKCPDTPTGVSVDTNGCPTKLTLHINFGTNSSKIGPKYDSEIAKAARCINDYPGNVVYIDGHTDSDGSRAYNQKLSEQRATAVKNRLISNFDIPAEKVTARGFGEEQPVADNNTAEGRALNRRVDVACGAN